MNKELTELTVSIVSYNTRDFLDRCLDSIYRNTSGIAFEVIVVDNASNDDSVAMLEREFPQVRLIANADNRFFTRAHNQSLSIARGRYFLILNSDTEVPPETLSKLVRFLEENRNVGAVGCRELRTDGTLELTGSTFSSPWIEMLEHTVLSSVPRLRSPSRRYRMVNWSRATSRDVDVLTDCFLMVRTDLLRELGGYDERYLLYYTENDLCLCIWQRGYRVHFLADSHYIHHGHRSTMQIGIDNYNRIYEQDMFAYYDKHVGHLRTCLIQGGFLLMKHLVRPFLKLASAIRDLAESHA